MSNLKELFEDYRKTAKIINLQMRDEITYSGIVIFVGDDYIRLADKFDISSSSAVITKHIIAIYDN